MMTVLFVFLSLAMITATAGFKRLGIGFFSITIISAVFYFFNLITTSINIQL